MGKNAQVCVQGSVDPSCFPYVVAMSVTAISATLLYHYVAPLSPSLLVMTLQYCENLHQCFWFWFCHTVREMCLSLLFVA